MTRPKHAFGIAIIIIFVVGLDFFTKEIARTHLQSQLSQPFIPGILQFTLANNLGAAFSLGYQNAALVTGIAFLITALLIYWTFFLRRSTDSIPESIGLGFLIGGACGNLFERLLRGSVTDFLDFAFMSFPVFNLADVCIDIGIGIFLLSQMSSDHPHNKSK